MAGKSKKKDKFDKEQYRKAFKKKKAEYEKYLYEVEKCTKAGGRHVECVIKVRDIMDEKDRKKKAAEKKAAKTDTSKADTSKTKSKK